MSKEAVNSKELVKELAKEGRKIRFNDRVECEVIKATKHYKLGQVIEPHRVFAEELIKNKIAKELK